MVVAGGTQRTVKEGNKGKKKQLTIQYKPFKWSPGVLKGDFGAWMQKRSYRHYGFFIFTLFNILLESHTPTLSSFCSRAGPLFHCRMFPHCFRDLKSNPLMLHHTIVCFDRHNLKFDRWRSSNVAEDSLTHSCTHTHTFTPLPHNTLRGHEKHQNSQQIGCHIIQHDTCETALTTTMDQPL